MDLVLLAAPGAARIMSRSFDRQPSRAAERTNEGSCFGYSRRRRVSRGGGLRDVAGGHPSGTPGRRRAGRRRTGGNGGPFAAKTTGLPYRGIAMQVQRIDNVERLQQERSTRSPPSAPTPSSSSSTPSRRTAQHRHLPRHAPTPTPEKLGDLIQYAKSKKLRVILMPIVLLEHPRATNGAAPFKPEAVGRLVGQLSRDDPPLRQGRRGEPRGRVRVGSELVSTERKVERMDCARSARSGENFTASSPTRPTGTITRRSPSGISSI